MAYTLPLTAAQLMAILPIRDMVFDILEALEMSETGGGEILTADLGTRLWQGEVTLDDMQRDEAAKALAMLSAPRQAGASFMVHDVGRVFPRYDPTGAILGASSPTLHQVNANMRDIRLIGLPSGYRINRHDYLAFSYGTNPVRYALHRAVNFQQANGSGTFGGWLEVVPAIRPGYAIGANVTLIRPTCKAVIVPGSVNPGRRRATMTVGASFKFMQTLR